jgi:hypothetical protein
MTTVAIIAFAHCGTTMVAGICEVLGVPMVGTSYHSVKREDWEVVAALQEGRFAELAEQRNAQHEHWGFKFPGAWKYADVLQENLRDPLYLTIWKDPASVARRRFGRSQDRWLRKVANTCQRMRESVDGIRHSGLPVHTLSYCRAVADPAQFVSELAEMIGLHPTIEQLARAQQYIQPVGWVRNTYPEVEPWI